jgi:hypothetical protein
LPVGKKDKNNWQQIDIWAFRSSLPTGRQASSVPIRKENKATGVIADIYNNELIFFNFHISCPCSLILELRKFGV